jgi:hypothetical protein
MSDEGQQKVFFKLLSAGVALIQHLSSTLILKRND